MSLFLCALTGVGALRSPSALPQIGARRLAPLASSASSEVSVEAPTVDYAASEGETPATERFRAIALNKIDQCAEDNPRLLPKLQDIKRSALIFPFKASPYLVDELIDWDLEGDIGEDPFYRLVFPTMDMLTQEHQDLLNGVCDAGDPAGIKAAVETIRESLNPHPAGQKELNAPKVAELTGVQHKYAETVLFFAAAAQTCHAYCTYCFRWAQFIGDADLRFAQKDADSLFDYLEAHEEVSDILFTGGDPMIMRRTCSSSTSSRLKTRLSSPTSRTCASERAPSPSGRSASRATTTPTSCTSACVRSRRWAVATSPSWRT